MGIEHRLILSCDVCSKTALTVFEEDVGPTHNVNVLWYLPETWSYVRGRLVCEEHEIEIKENSA